MKRIWIVLLLAFVTACMAESGDASREQGTDTRGDSATGDTVTPAGDTVMARDTMGLDG